MGSGASKKKSDTSADTTKLLNSAFVFIKPHANNETTQKLVSTTLQVKGIKIVKEGEFKGEEIDKGMLIDQHYYAIASKATLLKANQIPVPSDKFQESSAFRGKLLLQKTVLSMLWMQ